MLKLHVIQDSGNKRLRVKRKHVKNDGKIHNSITESSLLISLSSSQTSCQERVIVMSGEEDALRKAVVEILRSIQGDAHLEAIPIKQGKWMW